jgi:hypothetical protein
LRTKSHGVVFIKYLLGCSGTKSTSTAATYWPIAPVLDHRRR